MGAFTTCSTFIFETKELRCDSEWWLPLDYFGIHNIGGLAALLVGLAIGRLLEIPRQKKLSGEPIIRLPEEAELLRVSLSVKATATRGARGSRPTCLRPSIADGRGHRGARCDGFRRRQPLEISQPRPSCR